MTKVEKRKLAAEKRRLKREFQRLSRLEAEAEEKRLHADAFAWRRHQNSPRPATLDDHLKGYLDVIARGVPQYDEYQGGIRCVIVLPEGDVMVGIGFPAATMPTPPLGKEVHSCVHQLERTAYLSAVRAHIEAMERKRLAPSIQTAGANSRYQWRQVEDVEKRGVELGRADMGTTRKFGR